MSIFVEKNNLMTRTIFWIPLVIICSMTLFFILPLIYENIDDPNMIIYFNHDEGGQMDLIWSYYSGERRDSFQWDFDYGLENVYIADIAHFLSRAMHITFTPGTFVLILRWFHMVSWIGALIFLWFLMQYHFGNIWQSYVVVCMLAVRPALSILTHNFKPEPLTLLIMLIGFHYTLRLIEEPSRKNLFISIAMASIAFIVKFTGLFLLPMIIVAMHLAERYHDLEAGNKTFIFPTLKTAWTLPAFVGSIIITMLWTILNFYERKSTGTTWSQQFGFWGSLVRTGSGLYIFFLAAFLIFASVIPWFFAKSRSALIRQTVKCINRINSYTLVVFSIFIGFVMLFGFRWIISPRYFILTYSQLGPIMGGGKSIQALFNNEVVHSLVRNIGEQLKAFDPFLMILFVLYLCAEVLTFKKNVKLKTIPTFKRTALLLFLAAPFGYIFSLMRFAPHHIFPFFVVMTILVMQGIDIFMTDICKNNVIKNAVVSIIALLFVIDIGINGKILIQSLMYQAHKDEDVIFEVAKWWRDNVPKDAVVVADHHINVYIPPEYKNIKVTTWGSDEKGEYFRHLVDAYSPQFIYYNIRWGNKECLPVVDELLPARKVTLVASFSSEDKRYQRRLGEKFVIYKILY